MAGGGGRERQSLLSHSSSDLRGVGQVVLVCHVHSYTHVTPVAMKLPNLHASDSLTAWRWGMKTNGEHVHCCVLQECPRLSGWSLLCTAEAGGWGGGGGAGERGGGWGV